MKISKLPERGERGGREELRGKIHLTIKFPCQLIILVLPHVPIHSLKYARCLAVGLEKRKINSGYPKVWLADILIFMHVYSGPRDKAKGGWHMVKMHENQISTKSIY